MAIAAKNVVQRAVDISQDLTSVRWPAAEWVRWLNDGQREIALYRPDAFTTYGPIALVAGPRQSLPANSVKLIDIVNNTGGDKSAIRKVERGILDDQIPGWYGLAGVALIKHYTFDERDPRSFYVYPPAAADGASVNAVWAIYPTDVAAPADGATYADVVGNVGVADIFGNALLDYMLYRAYLKDANYAGNGARSTAHYAAFANALGVEIKATMVVSPGQTAGNAAGAPAT